MIWHSAHKDEVLAEIGVDDKLGLANGIADERLAKYGQNIITNIEKPTFISFFLSQLKNKMVISLIVIAFLSFFVSLMYDAVDVFSPLLIIAIVVINAVISAYYLYTSKNMLEDIKQYTNPKVTVLREGILKSVNASLLVPGDIILLEEGDYIPADARLIEANEFRCNESFLTGNDVPVEKYPDMVLEDITPIEKRSNIVFSGCSVVHGNAKAVVIATGFDTEAGRTVSILQQDGENRLPLQNKLENIGKITNMAILAICFIVFIIGMIQNFASESFATMTLKVLLNSVALAVAAIPEGLPAITTVVISIGIHRILNDQIILKEADVAELIGRTDVICCDKTGVFTHNKMAVSRIYDGKQLVDIENDGIDETTSMILRVATVCSTLNNDSTENAIEKACLAYNSMSKQDIDNLYPHISEIPFDSDRKTMTVITMINEKPFAIVKGAAELVIPNCIGCNREDILNINEQLANDAYRIVCIAMRPLSEIPANPSAEDIEKNLTFVGLIALNDPPRSGVVEEIAACDAAGITTIMITGDNLTTAKTIARRIGILKDGTSAISGSELSALTDDELADTVQNYTVYARVSPNDKLRIVKAWQKRGKIVTITGDSIQDANALAQAEVGCAIGRFGTDIAKGSANIIIQNNRFDSIVRAVKESRSLFSNIKKSVSYLFSCNFGEILTVLFGLLIFKCMPIAAVQLLWINLLTDCAPAISLSMEKAEKDVMKTKPLSSIGRIFDLKTVIAILLQSIVIAVTTLIAFGIGFDFGDTSTAMTMAFATLGITQIFHCINNKFSGTIFNKEFFANKFMNFSVLITLFVVLFLIFTPAGFVFGFNLLTFSQFLICLALSVVIIPFTEILKLIFKPYK